MSVALLIPENWDVPLLLSWGVQFTRAERTDLRVILVKRRPNKSPDKSPAEKATIERLSPDFEEESEPVLKQLMESLPDDFLWQHSDESELSSVDIAADAPIDTAETKYLVHVTRVVQKEPTPVILNQLSSIDLLIVPRHATVRIGNDDFEMERLLFRDAPCRTMQLRPGTDNGQQLKRILVPTGSPDHSDLSLDVAMELVEANDGEATALYVEPEVDEVAELVGHRILNRIVSRSLGKKTNRLRQHVVLSDNVVEGVREEIAKEKGDQNEKAQGDTTQAKTPQGKATIEKSDQGYDLVIASANYHGRVHRLLFHGISEQLLTTVGDTPVAVIRRAMPLTSRISRRLHEGCQSLVPQLDREHRIALVDRIQTNSRWDFDFIALTCLSTLIAAMGLLQNSSAVVIGAMLVAPLMTPLLGAGLSLVQGNKILLKSALGSVLRGFLLAFAIGWMLGVCMRTFSPLTGASEEMMARGSPGLLDLFVALISGIAAAYAIGRPNLLSALPGVAIAAALVPPIATSGLAVAFSDFQLGLGAAMLFFTNIVAIILGTGVSLWLVGVRNTHEHGSFHKWTLWIAGVLILFAVGLAFFESNVRIQTGLVRAVREHLHDHSDYRLVEAYMNRKTDPPSLHVKVEGAAPADAALAKEVLHIAKLNGLDEVRLELETQITTVVTDSR